VTSVQNRHRDASRPITDLGMMTSRTLDRSSPRGPSLARSHRSMSGLVLFSSLMSQLALAYTARQATRRHGRNCMTGIRSPAGDIPCRSAISGRCPHIHPASDVRGPYRGTPELRRASLQGWELNVSALTGLKVGGILGYTLAREMAIGSWGYTLWIWGILLRFQV
jgi:hypothetical protein